LRTKSKIYFGRKNWNNSSSNRLVVPMAVALV